jgi:hypothetical protein
VPIDLFLTESEARAFPLPTSQRGLGELIDDYSADGNDRNGDLSADVEEVTLPPAPLDCELPRRGHDPAVSVWGYGRCSLTNFHRRVAAVSTAVGIESTGSQVRPGIEEALRQVGTGWTSKPVRRLATVAELLAVGQGGPDAQPDALNLRLLTAASSRRQFEELESSADGRRPSRHSGQVPKTPPAWGRLVFVNDPTECPTLIPPSSFEDVSLDVDGLGAIALRIHVARRRMAGTADSYLLVVACGGPFDDAQARKLDALLRKNLEHALVHEWLTARAEQVNDRQAECLSELLDEGPDPSRVEDLRRQLALLRYAFVDEIEFVWDYDVNRDPGAGELCGAVDRGARLTRRWKGELARFERLVSLASVAHSVGFSKSRGQIQIPEIIPGFKEELNLFAQVAMWWRYRGRLRNDATDKVPALQRPGPRRGRVPPGAREIEIHPFANRPALFAELSASIALTSFMTAASAVFLGVVLQKGERSTLPMDVLFLFVATFGFLFATLIYANASGRLARHGTFGYEAQVEIANRVSEYLGVFPLLIAIPLSVSRFLKDGPIPWAVAALALLAIIAYHYVRGASLLERDISDERIGSDWQRKFVFVPALAGLMTLTFLGQLLHSRTLEIFGAIGFGVLSLLMVLLSAMLPERTNPQEYLVDDWDGLHNEMPSFSAAAGPPVSASGEARRSP